MNASRATRPLSEIELAFSSSLWRISSGSRGWPLGRNRANSGARFTNNFSNALRHGPTEGPYVLALENKEVSLGSPARGNAQPIASRIGSPWADVASLTSAQ